MSFVDYFKKPKYRYCFVAVVVGLTVVFGYFAYSGFTSPQPQASLTVRGEAYDLQQRVDKIFPREAHTAPYQVYSPSGSNILTQQVLNELYRKSEQLRTSDFGQKHLINFRHPDFGKTNYKGFFTVADVVESILNEQNSSLAEATPAKFEKALNEAFTNTQYGPYFQLTSSEKLTKGNGKWKAPAFQFYVQADNKIFGGGVFRRTIGSTEQIIQKEEFNRVVEDRLQLDTNKASLLGIGIDLNLQAEDEGYSVGIMVRNVLLIIMLATLTGLLLRSWRVGFTALMGLLALFVWILGFPVLMGGLVKSSLMVQVILPLAFMAIGIDFFVYAANEYDLNRDKGNQDNSTQTTTGIITIFKGVGIALFLAGVSDAIAFGSNYISPVEAVRSFAATGVFASFAALIIMGVFAPLLLSIWDKLSFRKQRERVLVSVRTLVTTIINHQTLVIAFFLITTIISVVGVLNIDRNLSPKDFISGDSNFVKSIDVRDKHWGDTRGERATIFVSGSLQSQEGQTALDDVTKNLHDNQYLAHRPETNQLILPLGNWEITDLGGKKTQAASLAVEIVGSRDLQTVTKARRAIKEDLSPFAQITNDYGVTGSPFTREASLNAVTDSVTETFSVAALLIFIILLATFRSFKFAFAALVPIGLVALWTYGFMGLAGFSLNFITATIAAVSLGIGIDYSIHIVQSFRQKYRRHGRAKQALLEVADTTMFASLTAFVSSIAGFLVLATAPMPMFATYGILGAAMITFAFINVIGFLPLLILWLTDDAKTKG